MRLNDKGQCPECLIKPIAYKGTGWRSSERQKFCHRCARSFDYDTGMWRENYHWKSPTEKKP